MFHFRVYHNVLHYENLLFNVVFQSWVAAQSAHLAGQPEMSMPQIRVSTWNVQGHQITMGLSKSNILASRGWLRRMLGKPGIVSEGAATFADGDADRFVDTWREKYMGVLYHGCITIASVSTKAATTSYY
jgi:hypothetical protein